MTDQQLLEIQNPADKTEIRNALVNKISDLDFEIDIERIFSCILCAKRLTQQMDVVDNVMVISDAERDTQLSSKVVCDSPDKLVEQFNILYDNAASRFSKSLWKEAVRYVKENDPDNLAGYCKAVADFLTQKPFLRSETLRLLANAFPFSTFFPNRNTEETKDFWQKYGYVYNLLRKGNAEFDLLAHTVNPEQYTHVQLDDIYNRVLYSARYYREKKYAQAFNALSEGIPADVKPLMAWQREITILYKAAFIEQEEQVVDIFKNTLNAALSYFPVDEQLLYVQAKYILYTYEPDKAKDAIIEIVKLVPHHPKCMFLLGKCYMQLSIYRAAMIIFRNLEEVDPLNLQYTIAGAKAKRAYIDFCISEHNLQGNSKQYYITMVSELIENSMFDEAVTFAAEAPKGDADLSALLIYATDVRNYDQRGIKNKDAIFDALLSADDNGIRRQLKEHYLRDIPNWSEIAEEKKFIQTYYEENPTDAMTNYHMGMYFYSITDYNQAYDYFLKAKALAPSDPIMYYNLARVSALIKNYEEAIQYIRVYLMYNKYQLQANEYYCEWTYVLQQYNKAHESAKWILSICRTNEFKPVYFFYFTAGLKLYLNSIPQEYHNPAYIYESLERYDQYATLTDFRAEEDGRKSMCWAAKLCFDIADYEKCLAYVTQTLPHITDYDTPSAQMGLFELLPQCLYKLERYEELINLVSGPAQHLLNEKGYQYNIGTPAYYLSLAYGALEQYETQMEWSLICVNCYTLSDTPPIDWIENYLTDKFDICVEHDIDSYIIPIGAAYIQIIKTVNPNHIWMAHNMANVYASLQQSDQALEYHRKCLEFCMEFPNQCEEERIGSQEFINKHTASGR
jgi:hypothetical protein